MSLVFRKQEDNEISVLKETGQSRWNFEFKGALKFDKEQDAWVYWFDSPTGLEGTTYFKDLEETKEAIRGDLNETI